MKETSLKVFVWIGFAPDVTKGIAFAVAETEEEARNKIEEKIAIEIYEWGDLHVHEIDEKPAYYVFGYG